MNREEPEQTGYSRTGRVNGTGQTGETAETGGGEVKRDEAAPAPLPAAPASSPAPEHATPLAEATFFTRSRLSGVGLALLAGLCLTLIQLAAALSVAPGSNLAERYYSLFQHDSFWFENIMVRGYVSTVPPAPYKSYDVSNVAFFPAYPYLAGWMLERLDLDTREALLLTSQLAAWLFWSYAAALLLRWRTPWPAAVAVLGVIGTHPAAFYLVAAYSEALFLAALVGFLFWSSRAGAGSAILAAAHGFCMTATRIVGIPCVAAAGGGDRGFFRRLERRIWIGFVSLLGAALFFALCQGRFGSWDFYMQTQQAGWGVMPEYLEPLRLENYTHIAPDWTEPREVAEFSLAVTLWMAVALGAAEVAARRQAQRRGISSGFMQRLPFYFCAAVVFYVSMAGVASVAFESMIRYQFCTYALAALAAAHLLACVPPRSKAVRAVLWALAALLIAAGAYLQAYYAAVFTRGGWFA